MALSMADHINNSPEHRLKILVVDDDEMSRRLMRLLLIRDNHDVQVVANGLEAVDAVKYQKFDIVLMDLQMPVMDGMEASRQIRAWENGNVHTYIVALTASYLPEQGQILFEAGIDNYISKPFEVENIRRLLGFIARSDHTPPAHNPIIGASEPIKGLVLDIQTGTQRVGDLQSFRELLGDFIRGLPGRIKTMEELLETRDMASLAREAHNLKGVSSNLGAWELFEYASKLDNQSNEGYTDRQKALLLDLKTAETNLQKTANDFLEKKGQIGAST